VNRLRRFPENRFIGRRDLMVVYDCERSDQFVALSEAVAAHSLDMMNLLQAFAPDLLHEAHNRGFTSPDVPPSGGPPENL
jgi:hypothetical protein